MLHLARPALAAVAATLALALAVPAIAATHLAPAAYAEPPPPALGTATAAHVDAWTAGCRPRLAEVPDPDGGPPIHAVLCDQHGVVATTGGAR